MGLIQLQKRLWNLPWGGAFDALTYRRIYFSLFIVFFLAFGIAGVLLLLGGLVHPLVGMGLAALVVPYVLLLLWLSLKSVVMRAHDFGVHGMYVIGFYLTYYVVFWFGAQPGADIVLQLAAATLTILSVLIAYHIFFVTPAEKAGYERVELYEGKGASAFVRYATAGLAILFMLFDIHGLTTLLN